MGRPLGTLRLKNASSVIIYQSFRINRRPFRFGGLIDIFGWRRGLRRELRFFGISAWKMLDLAGY